MEAEAPLLLRFCRESRPAPFSVKPDAGFYWKPPPESSDFRSLNPSLGRPTGAAAQISTALEAENTHNAQALRQKVPGL